MIERQGKRKASQLEGIGNLKRRLGLLLPSVD